MRWLPLCVAVGQSPLGSSQKKAINNHNRNGIPTLIAEGGSLVHSPLFHFNFSQKREITIPVFSIFSQKRKFHFTILSFSALIGNSYIILPLLFKRKGKILNTCTLTASQVRELEQELICPDCGGKLIVQGGCPVCYECGYSKCG